MFSSKKKVAYYFDEEIGTFNYSTQHPMKPIRVAMTDDLIRNYGLIGHMNEFVIHWRHRRI
jgi:histone deacetylase 1/2